MSRFTLDTTPDGRIQAPGAIEQIRDIARGEVAHTRESIASAKNDLSALRDELQQARDAIAAVEEKIGSGEFVNAKDEELRELIAPSNSEYGYKISSKENDEKLARGVAEYEKYFALSGYKEMLDAVASAEEYFDIDVERVKPKYYTLSSKEYVDANGFEAMRRSVRENSLSSISESAPELSSRVSEIYYLADLYFVSQIEQGLYVQLVTLPELLMLMTQTYGK